MQKQIKLLSVLRLCNLFGFNEFRFTKDKKKKNRYIALGITWILVAVMLLGYLFAMNMGYIYLGMSEIVPLVSAAMVSLFILFFSLFKAGSVIFQMKDYEMLIALPVSKTAIIVSRFFYMYVTNLAIGGLVMLPAIVLYGWSVRPGATFYLFAVLGTLLLPLLPLTLATIFGAAVVAVSSRMKHKSLVSAFLSLVVVTAVLLLSMQNPESYNEQMLRHLSELVSEKISQTYPPAIWFANAAVQGKISDFLLLLFVSILVFGIMAAVLTRYFTGICTALQSFESGKAADYSKMKEASPLGALYKKEWKRYLSSSIYVTNTLMGGILMVIMAAAVFIIGVEKMEELMQMPGVIARALPFFIAMMPCIMPTTACAISMEGKGWWLTKSLPVRAKDIMDSKILVNLTIALPAYVIAELLCFLAVKPDVKEAVSLIVIPLVYILFMSAAGLAVNLALPVFDWENEVTVVKQSASTLVSMLVGFVAVGVPVIFLFVFGKTDAIIISLIATVVLSAITVLLYYKNLKKDLKKM